MTVQLTVSSGCAAQSGWTGTTAFSLGTIQNENSKMSGGVEVISQSFGTSNNNKGWSVLGQKRVITIKGRNTASSLANAQAFERNLYLICKYQTETMTGDRTCRYYNSTSVVYSIATSPGVQGMIVDYNVTKREGGGLNTVDYVITFVECTNII